MCGLVGMIDISTHNRGFFGTDKETFKLMMFLNQLRGRDGTGAFGVHKNGEIDTIKVVGNLDNFNHWLASEKFHDRIVTKYMAVFGHARLATMGSKVAKNSHPFTKGKYTLIHNGVIRNFDNLMEKRDKKDKKIEVDSELCVNLLNEVGPEEMLHQISGAFAFIWMNNEEGKIEFIRNYERPLYVFKGDHNNQMWLASDEAWLKFLEFKTHTKGTIKDTEPWVLYSLDIKTRELTSKKMTVFPPPVVSYHNPYNSLFDYYGSEWDEKSTTIITPTKKKPSSNVEISLGQEIHFLVENSDEHKVLEKGKSIPTYKTVIRGSLLGSPNIEVRHLGEGSYEASTEADYAIGKVISMQVSPPDSKLDLRIVVDHVRFFKAKDPSSLPSILDLELHNDGADPILITIGPNKDGPTVTLAQFNSIAAKGCIRCGGKKGVITIGDFDEISLFSDGFVCKVCMSSETNKVSHG